MRKIVATVSLAIYLFPSISLGQVQKLANQISEGSDSSITVSFNDQSGMCVRPNTVEFMVQERSTGEVLLPAQTAIVPTPVPTAQRSPGGNYACQTRIDFSKCAARMVLGTATQTNVISLFYTYGLNSITPIPGPLTRPDSAEYTLVNQKGYVVVQGSPGTCIIATPTPTPTP